MKQDTYAAYGMEQYANQIMQHYRQLTCCEYKITEGRSKVVIAQLMDGSKKTFRGSSFNAVAYLINKEMNTPQFRDYIQMLKGDGA